MAKLTEITTTYLKRSLVATTKIAGTNSVEAKILRRELQRRQQTRQRRQSTGMGFFLLISAYFVPSSYDRKGAGQFLKDRLIRLGIPLLVYSWIISPLTWMVITYVTQGQLLPLGDYFPGVKFESIIGARPLWFVEALLIFSVVYVVCGSSSGPMRRYRPSKPTAGFPATRSLRSSRS